MFNKFFIFHCQKGPQEKIIICAHQMEYVGSEGDKCDGIQLALINT